MPWEPPTDTDGDGVPIREWIRSAHRAVWLNRPVTPDCFDGSGRGLVRLALWVAGHHAEPVRQHLIACRRCRFLYLSWCNHVVPGESPPVEPFRPDPSRDVP